MVSLKRWGYLTIQWILPKDGEPLKERYSIDANFMDNYHQNEYNHNF